MFRNLLFFILFVLLSGLNWTAMKQGVNYVGPLPFTFQRSLISAITLLPILLFLRKKFPTDRATFGRLLIYSLMYAFQILLTQIGLVGENSGIGSVLTYTQPLFVYSLGMPLLREKVKPLNFLGVAIGFIGVVLLVVRGTSVVSIGSSLVLIVGGFIWAVMIIYYKKFLTHVDAFVTTSFQVSFGTLPLLGLSVVSRNLAFSGVGAYTEVLLYSSLGSLTAGTVLWLFLLKEEDATVVSGSSLLIPLAALLFGWQLLGEPIYVESVLGAALILGGTCLVNLRRHSET